MTGVKNTMLTVVTLLSILLTDRSSVSANICEVRLERSQTSCGKLQWLLYHPHPCDCTRVVMGDINSWIPERHYEPAAADGALLSDNIIKIRNHYGLHCPNKICSDKLGMENGDIPDDNVLASHTKGEKRWPWNGRLNAESFWACGSACVRGTQPWIQADIGYQTNVSGVITQGDGGSDGGSDDYVTTLKVSTFKTITSFDEVFVTDASGEVKVFQANTDRNTTATATFPEPVFARIVRITCLTKARAYWQMRFELLGCKRQT